MKLAMPEAIHVCSTSVLLTEVVNISQASLSLAPVKLTLFRQTFSSCMDTIDTFADMLYKAIQRFQKKLQRNIEGVLDTPQRMLQKSRDRSNRIPNVITNLAGVLTSTVWK